MATKGKKTGAKTAVPASSAPAAPKRKAQPAQSSFNPRARVDASAEEIRKLIAEAAYFRAKQRGFAPGHELEDWVAAEAEVTRRLQGSP